MKTRPFVQLRLRTARRSGLQRFLTAIICLWSATALADDTFLSGHGRDGVNGIYENPLAIRSLETMSETGERPLFSMTRRPPPSAAVPVREVQTPKPPPEPPKVSLLGIVKDVDSDEALVRLGTDKLMRVRIGDEIGGWKLIGIDARRVILSLDDRTARFTLFNMHASNQIAKTAAMSSASEKRQLNQRH